MGELQKAEVFMLRTNNNTRWNSTWEMINLALQQEDQVDAFCNLEKKLVNDKLTKEDWADLKQLMAMLEPFKWLIMLGEN